MILPGSFAISLLLVVLSLLCWGSWANTFKMSRDGWRFELYYLDFAFGFFAVALLAALTFGSLGFDGFSFTDDILHAGKRQLFFGFSAGVIFNLANMFLMAAISVAGMAVSFPICFALALAIGTIWNFVAMPAGNMGLLITGVLAILASTVFAILGYRSYAESKLMELIQSGKAKSTRKKISMKGISIGLAAGFLMGFFIPLVNMSQAAEVGVGPYTCAFLVALGALISTFVYNLFFMNLPVEGEPVEVVNYFKGSLRNHLLGVLGGAIWCFGLLGILVASSAEGAGKISPWLWGLPQAAPVLAILWGLFFWNEFAGPESRGKAFLVITSLLFLMGLGLIFAAPALAR